MKGLWIEGGTIRLRDDLPRPAPRPGETRVRVLRAGICATDLALRRGYMGFVGVPGHEFVGLAIDGPLAGERVVGEINAGCGHCTECSSGLERHCPKRTVLGILGRPGAFAEELSLPTRNLHRVPVSVALDEAVFTEPLAAAFEILEQVKPSRGTEVLVVGDGKLGILCGWVLHRAGLAVSVEGRHPERRELLPPGVAYRPADGSGGGSAGSLPETPERFDVVVEVTGNPSTLGALVSRVRPRGTIVVKTTSERAATIDTSGIVVHEISVVGSRCGPFGPALAALAEGAIPVGRLVAARYRLSQGVAAFDRAERRGTLKVVLENDGEGASRS